MEHYIRQYIIRLVTPFLQSLKKHLIISVLLVLYLIAFWFLFFAKGIYVDGYFYKKSANLTTVTYTCKNPSADFKRIILEKQLNKSVITIDDSYVLTVNSAGGVSIDGNTGPDSNLPDARWDLIANQSAERSRGFGSKPWYIVILIFCAMFLIRKYSTQFYSFIFKNKAAGEGYYKAVNIAFNIVYIAGLVYLIIPV